MPPETLVANEHPVPLKKLWSTSAGVGDDEQFISLVPAVDVWNRFMKKVHLNEARMEFVDNHPENPDINYKRNPIAGVRELERFMNALEAKLGKIQMPALVIQGQGDPVVNPKGSVRVFQRIGSEDKTYVLFSFNRHGIVLGEGAERVHRTVWEFIDRR